MKEKYLKYKDHEPIPIDKIVFVNRMFGSSWIAMLEFTDYESICYNWFFWDTIDLNPIEDYWHNGDRTYSLNSEKARKKAEDARLEADKIANEIEAYIEKKTKLNRKYVTIDDLNN